MVRPSDAVLAALSGSALLALGAARATLGLNDHLRGSLSDVAWLHLDLLVLYGGLGLLAGGVGALGVRVIRNRRPGVARGLIGLLFLVPVVYLALLPSSGSGLPWLTDLLSARPGVQIGVVVLLLAALAALSSFVLRGFEPVLRERPGLRRVFPLVVALLFVGSIVAGGVDESGIEVASADAPGAVAPATPESPPAPVLLLCVDGADLDDRIEPLARRGELPTFARLMREGAWGPLATIEPTLSPVIWTTIATGRPPEEHGIHQFVSTRLPGMEQRIHSFPLHLGLNFRFFRWVPGFSGRREFVTSNQRRSEALWDIVGRFHPVGVYRWLMSFPAEPVNGFSVAGGIAWVQFESGGGGLPESVHPPDLPLPPRRRPVGRARLAPFVGSELEVVRGDRRLRMIRQALRDSTARALPDLVRRFDVRFAAASFHPVDAFQHLFHEVDRSEAPFGGAIDAAYRLTDRRLGELLAALGPETRVVVVSDHGFDFEAGHHTRRPAGIFFAHGPGIAAGKRVDGLGIYDVAPLVLHLLDLPLPTDLRGVGSRAYREVLTPEFLAGHPGSEIPTYGPRRVSSAEGEVLRDDAIEDALRSLGYVR